MNDEKKAAAREAGLVAVEHEITTTWSDDRQSLRRTVSHNANFACRICKGDWEQLTALARRAGGNPE